MSHPGEEHWELAARAAEAWHHPERGPPEARHLIEGMMTGPYARSLRERDQHRLLMAELELRKCTPAEMPTKKAWYDFAARCLPDDATTKGAAAISLNLAGIDGDDRVLRALLMAELRYSTCHPTDEAGARFYHAKTDFESSLRAYKAVHPEQWRAVTATLKHREERDERRQDEEEQWAYTTRFGWSSTPHWFYSNAILLELQTYADEHQLELRQCCAKRLLATELHMATLCTAKPSIDRHHHLARWEDIPGTEVRFIGQCSNPNLYDASAAKTAYEKAEAWFFTMFYPAPPPSPRLRAGAMRSPWFWMPHRVEPGFVFPPLTMEFYATEGFAYDVSRSLRAGERKGAGGYVTAHLMKSDLCPQVKTRALRHYRTFLAHSAALALNGVDVPPSSIHPAYWTHAGDHRRLMSEMRAARSIWGDDPDQGMTCTRITPQWPKRHIAELPQQEHRLPPPMELVTWPPAPHHLDEYDVPPLTPPPPTARDGAATPRTDTETGRNPSAGTPDKHAHVTLWIRRMRETQRELRVHPAIVQTLHREAMTELLAQEQRDRSDSTTSWYLGRPIADKTLIRLADYNENWTRVHEELHHARPRTRTEVYFPYKHWQWRRQLNETKRLVLAELRLRTCTPEETVEAKEAYEWALYRLPAYAAAEIQGRRPWRRPMLTINAGSPTASPTPSPPPSPPASPTPSAPPSPPTSPPSSPTPSPPPSPPGSPEPDAATTDANSEAGGTTEHPPDDGAPSPPPSPPHTLERRLAALEAAENVVATTYAYPNKPERFVEDVHPHLVQLILAEGRRPMVKTIEAVYAVLVRSDERCASHYSDLEVSTTLEVPMRTFATWKRCIDTLRSEVSHGGLLLDLAGEPGTSAPPSPPGSDSEDEDKLIGALALMEEMHLEAKLNEEDLETRAEMEASMARCRKFNYEPWHGETRADFESVAGEGEIFEAFSECLPPEQPGRQEEQPGALSATSGQEVAATPPRKPAGAGGRWQDRDPVTLQDCKMERRSFTPPPLKSDPFGIAWSADGVAEQISWALKQPPKKPRRTAKHCKYGPRQPRTRPEAAEATRERRRGAAAYLAIRRLRGSVADAMRQSRASGAGCSSDPHVPTHKYAYGTETIEYNPWDGTVVPCAVEPDIDGNGDCLRYRGRQTLPRGRLVGVMLADVKVPIGVLRTWSESDPLAGEYAVTSQGWALVDPEGRSKMSKANESARPNIEMREIDVNPQGDAPSFSLMAFFSVAAIEPGDELSTDYGDDYYKVRRARGYERPYVHARDGDAVRWLSDADGDLEHTLRSALNAGQLDEARRWGGVTDHACEAGTPRDPNRRRGHRERASGHPTANPPPPSAPPSPPSPEAEEAAADAATQAPSTPTPSAAAAREAVHQSAHERTHADAMASPDAGELISPWESSRERAHATLHWAGRGPAPRGWQWLHLHEGGTVLTFRNSIDGHGDWGGDFTLHLTPPETGDDGEELPGLVTVQATGTRGSGPEAPRLLISWAEAGHDGASTAITMEVADPYADYALGRTRVGHGETLAFGTPLGAWRGSTLQSVLQATSRLDWAFRLELHGARPPTPCQDPSPDAHSTLDRHSAIEVEVDTTAETPEASQEAPTPEPAPTCELDGCEQPCRERQPEDEGGGRFHNYCGWTHAQQAIAQRRSPDAEAPTCARPGCDNNAWRLADAQGGGFHRCCGRQCEARLARAEADPHVPVHPYAYGTEAIEHMYAHGTEASERMRRRGVTRTPKHQRRGSAAEARRQRRGTARQETRTMSLRTALATSTHDEPDNPDSTQAADVLARRLAVVKMATHRTCTWYAEAQDECDACITDEDHEFMVARLDALTGGGAADAVAAHFAPLRSAYDDAAWADMARQRGAYLHSEGRTADCACCGRKGTVPQPPRTPHGCLCGGGVCRVCGIDSCACPWDGDRPAPPAISAASMQRNSTEWGFIELPRGDPYAPTILCMGDASGAMATACAARFPSEICLAVDYHTRGRVQHGLYWCGDVRDVLFRQRWRIIIAHPECAGAARSNTTGRDQRIESGELWWSMAFAVMLYCAPADVAIIEQPDSLLAQAYRQPDTTMQYLDYGVGFSKHWCLWRRGGDASFNPATPTTPGAAAHTHATHRLRHADRDEQKRMRAVTPPQMATALCNSINLTDGPFGRQPLYHEEVERLADGYRRHTGHEPPSGYNEPTAQPLALGERRALRTGATGTQAGDAGTPSAPRIDETSDTARSPYGTPGARRDPTARTTPRPPHAARGADAGTEQHSARPQHARTATHAETQSPPRGTPGSTYARPAPRRGEDGSATKTPVTPPRHAAGTTPPLVIEAATPGAIRRLTAAPAADAGSPATQSAAGGTGTPRPRLTPPETDADPGHESQPAAMTEHTSRHRQWGAFTTHTSADGTETTRPGARRTPHPAAAPAHAPPARTRRRQAARARHARGTAATPPTHATHSAAAAAPPTPPARPQGARAAHHLPLPRADDEHHGPSSGHVTPGAEHTPEDAARARQRRYRWDTPMGCIEYRQRVRRKGGSDGHLLGPRIDVARSPEGADGHHLTDALSDSARRIFGLAASTTRAMRRSDGPRPADDSFMTAFGIRMAWPTSALPTSTKIDNQGRAELEAALEAAARRVSEGERLTITDTAPLDQSPAETLVPWLRRRATAIREADDALAARELREAEAARRHRAATTAQARPPPHEDAGAAPTPSPTTDVPPGASDPPTDDGKTASSPTDGGHTTALIGGEAADAPTVNVTQAVAPGARRIALVAIALNPGAEHGDGKLLACMPSRGDALFGVNEATSTRRRRREALGEEAMGWLELGCPKEAYFHAGDVQTHEQAHHEHPDDDPLAPTAKRTIVFTALLGRPPENARRASSDGARNTGSTSPAAQASDAAWWTLGELAAAAIDPAGVARYRAGAAAMAKVDSYMQPTGETLSFMRWGVTSEKQANTTGAARATAHANLEHRMLQAAAEATEFQRLLEGVEPTNGEDGEDDDGDDGFADMAHGLAPLVDTDPGATLPAELLRYELPAAPNDAALRPYRHTAVVYPTEPLPEPAPQPPLEDGFWPHDVHDIVEQWALDEIDAWLKACLAWHRSGGPAHGRPQAIAFGEDAIRPRARGRLWDLRGGAGNIKLFDPATEPKRTGLNLDFAASEFADHPDQELVSMICNGVQMKTDAMPPQIVLMPNLLSLYSENGGVAAAAAQMAEMEKLGFLAFFDHLPCIPFRAMPRGVVPKKGTEELRGIGDQGQPRKRLCTRRSGEPVTPLNVMSREGEWSHQDMDSLETAAHNSAVLQSLADLNGEAVVDMAFDFSKFFHQLFYYVLMLWQMGAIVPRQTAPGQSDALDFALEYVMTMGATPSSQVAQRFANAITAAVYRRMHAIEETRWREPSLAHELTDAARSALAERAQLPPNCYGTQAALFNLLIYCDDARLACVGAARALRLLRVFHRVIGKRGLRLPLSRVEKQQTGVGVVWLGAHLSTTLGLIWVPKDKATKAAASLRTALRGELPVGDYRRLLGYLVSLLFMVGGNKQLLHHVFRPVKPGEELDSGPATLVTVDELMRPVLQQWLSLIMDVPGAPMLAAFAPTPPPSSTPRHRIRADAALEGTPSPGLGGWLYGHWFAVAIADHPGLERLDIPHLEFIAAGLAIITFADMLTGASLVCIETDALATAVSLTSRARSPGMQVVLDALLQSPAYNGLAPRLVVAHCSGAGNPMADAASRGYSRTLAAISEALGITSTRIDIPDEANAFLQRAVEGLRPIATARERRADEGHDDALATPREADDYNEADADPEPVLGADPHVPVNKYAYGTEAIEYMVYRSEAAPSRAGGGATTRSPGTPTRQPAPRQRSTPQPLRGDASPSSSSFDGSPQYAQLQWVPCTPPWVRSGRGASDAPSTSGAPARPKQAATGGAGRGKAVERHARKAGASRTPPHHSPPQPKRERSSLPRQTVLVPDTPPSQHGSAAPGPAGRSQQPARAAHHSPGPSEAARRAHGESPPRPIRGEHSDPPNSSPQHTAAAQATLRSTAVRLDFHTGPRVSWGDQRNRAESRIVVVPEAQVDTPQPHGDDHAAGGANARILREARRGLTEAAYARLRNDISEHAIRAPDHIVQWLAEVATQGDPTQAPITTQMQRGSNWKWWTKYCHHINVASPWRPDSQTLDAVGHQRESAIWAGALMWIYGRMQPRKGKFLPEGPPHFGKPKPPSPLSALAVLRGVRAEHVARGIQPPSLALASKRAHEQMLKYARAIGPENCVPERAIPMTHELICKVLTIPEGQDILKGGKAWHWTSVYGVSVRTVFHVLAQCGFRKAEVALGSGKWGSDKLSFASLKWIIGGETVLAPTVDQLRFLRTGDYAIIMPGPSKADCFGMRWGNNPIWLPFDATAAINAANALAQWEMHAAVAPEQRRTTPLFCGPEGVGTPLRAAALDELFFRMMAHVLKDAAIAKKYSIHGFRSYLASALNAAGCSGPEIQAALRWASDEALKVYQVVQRETYGGWLVRAEQIKLTGARASSLHAEGRHLPVYEPENMIADALATREEMRSRAEHADNNDIGVIRNLGVDGVVGDDD